MIDFHTHILPGIDDGSRDIEMTERMLRAEQKQGVTHIYATPHFYAHRRSVKQFIERRGKALEMTRSLIASSEPDSLPDVTAGAEVYYFNGMGRADQLRDLCIEGTDILLLEMPFEQWHKEQYKDITDILIKQKLRIVLAHVERYGGLQKNKEIWDRIMELPLTLQMNAGSFITGLASGMHARRTSRLCFSLLSAHESCIIGTDCHNLTDRAPNLVEARQMIEKKAGRARLTQLDEYTEKLLKAE